MAKIIEFPLNIEREWSRLEKILRDQMLTANAPEEVIGRVLAWHKETWLKYKAKSHFSFSLKLECVGPQSDADVCAEAVVQGLEKLQDQFRQLTAEMVHEMTGLKVALETYKHYHRSPPQ